MEDTPLRFTASTLLRPMRNAKPPNTAVAGQKGWTKRERGIGTGDGREERRAGESGEGKGERERETEKRGGLHMTPCACSGRCVVALASSANDSKTPLLDVSWMVLGTDYSFLASSLDQLPCFQFC